MHLEQGQKLNRTEMLAQLIEMQFERTTSDLRRGQFRLRGQVFEVMPVNEEIIYRLEISERIDLIEMVDAVTRKVKHETSDMWLFPAKHYVAGPEMRERAFKTIKQELKEQLTIFEKKGKVLEYERLKRRVNYDLEMIKNIGYCNGIENYSRHFDGRNAGEPPFSLLDYFNKGVRSKEKGVNNNFLTVIDESHVTVPQINGMYAGDKARKDTLVEHGFRLPSARDNRPLNYVEFEKRVNQTIYVSATPSEYELGESKQVVEQIVRPTGLVDPEIIVRPVTGKGIKNKEKGISQLSQIEDLIIRIDERIKSKERVLVTTLTKKMAEDLNDYLLKKKYKVKYLHSDIQTLERIETITALRKGIIDVIVGVNLLREGLDMPEVSLVAILDADKEGFLRSATSLIQTIGRAARNVNGQVILYADNITQSIEKAISETNRRRTIQLAYNKEHNITPKTIEKSIKDILGELGVSSRSKEKGARNKRTTSDKILELDLLGDKRPLEEIIKDKESQMKEAAKNLEFELAAILRDEIYKLNKQTKKTA
ncbi:MAG: UvrABC system protein B [Candidatus Magasanikbacteria bacterium GW2011_GWA2_37_8]|uniref:UvrABC system protein B n=1 Tax=Candidatus Magasanikbacteria bacterium GW2011_GWA2_37_8 TaxID=1619036 RepID=A0A0G0HEU3_9BACT|nr:MAG: UvrABC system protein B [Candidatus Magasanikbacteria bacterium GW2011_GWA2_37_8]